VSDLLSSKRFKSQLCLSYGEVVSLNALEVVLSFVKLLIVLTVYACSAQESHFRSKSLTAIWLLL